MGGPLAPVRLRKMQRLEQLESLRMDDNGFRGEEIAQLAFWTKTPKLRSLSLAANALDTDAAVMLAQKLHLMPHLAYLDASFNQIGLGGVDALVGAAHQHPRLRLQLLGNPGLAQHLHGRLLALLSRGIPPGQR